MDNVICESLYNVATLRLGGRNRHVLKGHGFDTRSRQCFGSINTSENVII